MRKTTLSLCLAASFAAMAANYLSTDFSSSRFPTGSIIENADGAELQPYIYANISADETAWVVKRQGDGYGYCALSPTRNDIPVDAETAPAADNRLIFPAVTVETPEAMVVWEAKSLHGDFPETYRVAARESGSQEWTDLYVCPGESHAWTHHAVSLRDFVGKDVEVAFISTTQRGFILAIDNVKIGIPPANVFDVVAEQISPRFFGEADKPEIRIKVANYGATKNYSEIRLYNLGNIVGSTNLPDGLKFGETKEITFDITDAPLNSKYSFTVLAVSADGSDDAILLNDCWIFCSNFARTSVIDRCSATWCPNCPTMGITTDRIKGIYGDQAIIIEAHVNDVMANAKYSNEYLSDFVRAIPMLVPNHEKNRFTYSLNSTDDYSTTLCAETVADVKAEYRIEGNRVFVDAVPSYASSVSNFSRYQLKYMLIGSLHSDTNANLAQQNSASSYKSNQFYMQPSIILPEMMFYHNVVLDWSDTPSLTVPASLADDITGFKAIAMVIDMADGHIVNAAIATEKSDSGIDDIVAEPDYGSTDDGWYTLQGIRLNERPDSPGIYIHRRRIVKL